MPLYTQLPDDIKTVDVIVPGGKQHVAPFIPDSSTVRLIEALVDWQRRNGRLHRCRPPSRSRPGPVDPGHRGRPQQRRRPVRHPPAPVRGAPGAGQRHHADVHGGRGAPDRRAPVHRAGGRHPRRRVLDQHDAVHARPAARLGLVEGQGLVGRRDDPLLGKGRPHVYWICLCAASSPPT